MCGKIKKMLETVCVMFAIMLLCGMTVHAKEVTVQNGNIQEALNQAGSSTEVVTVIIPPGEYVLSDILKVRSNTIIQATGAEFTLRSDLAQKGHPILEVNGVHDVTIQGGTWTSSNGTPIVLDSNVNKSITIDGVTIETLGNCRWGFEIHNGSQITIQNSTVNGGGIFAEKTVELKLYKNIVNNSKLNGIRTYVTEKCTIEENKILNAATYGVLIDTDNGSTIKNNEISGSASSSQRIDGEHGEGVVIIGGVNTNIISNKILNTHSNEESNGNGVIVASSTGVVVDSNTVSNSGNHGIQVTDSSTAITVKNNVVSNSQNAGIALSRTVQANLINNTITDTVVNGIACDGHEGRVTVNIEGGKISNTKCATSEANAPIWTDSTTGTISGVTIIDLKYNGITITKNSNMNIRNCRIYQSAVTNTKGIAVYASEASLNDNVISGFSEYGIYANRKDGANITGGNNTLTLPGTSGFSENAVFIAESTGSMGNNKLFDLSISATSASGGNYYPNMEAGAIIDGTIYTTTAGSDGRFSVSYPSVDTSKVAVYVKSPDGNVIILNAPNGTTLEGNTGGGTTQNPADTEKITAFVTRLYKNVLGRDPDQKGLNEWVESLAKGERTGADVAGGFFFSPEFIQKKENELSNEQYVEILYRTMMGRSSDPAGKKYWLDSIDCGFSDMFILNGFVGSKEFGEICDEYGIICSELVLTEPRDQNRGVTEFVSRNYTKALERSVDIHGLNDWCHRILYEGLEPGESVKGIVFSPEFMGHNHSNEKFVTLMYHTFFNREPDPAGYADWLGSLNNGTRSRNDVVEGFINAQEFRELVASFGL